MNPDGLAEFPHVREWLGYALCELAFKTDCCGPFAYAYRAGCWFYGKAGNAY